MGRFSFRKSSFWVVLHHWDAKVDFFALSWKSWFRDEQFGKKTYFDAKFVTRININHFSILINFWNETSVACQSVNQSFYYPSDFESHLSQSRKFWREIVFRGPKIVGNFAFNKIFFWSFHPVKTSNFAFFSFPENWKKIFWGIKVCKKSNFRKKNSRRFVFRISFLYNASGFKAKSLNVSDFKPTFVKLFRIRNSISTACLVWIKNSTTRQKLSRKFYKA